MALRECKTNVPQIRTSIKDPNVRPTSILGKDWLENMSLALSSQVTSHKSGAI